MNLTRRDQLARQIYDVWIQNPHLDLFERAQRAATVALVLEEESTRVIRRLALTAARRKEQAASVIARALAKAVFRLEQNGLGHEVDDILSTIAPEEVIAP